MCPRGATVSPARAVPQNYPMTLSVLLLHRRARARARAGSAAVLLSAPLVAAPLLAAQSSRRSIPSTCGRCCPGRPMCRERRRPQRLFGYIDTHWSLGIPAGGAPAFGGGRGHGDGAAAPAQQPGTEHMGDTREQRENCRRQNNRWLLPLRCSRCSHSHISAFLHDGRFDIARTLDEISVIATELSRPARSVAHTCRSSVTG